MLISNHKQEETIQHLPFKTIEMSTMTLYRGVAAGGGGDRIFQISIPYSKHGGGGQIVPVTLLPAPPPHPVLKMLSTLLHDMF